MMNFSALQRALSGKRLPAVVVDLAAFDANAKSLADMVVAQRPDLKIRIATKSLRVPALIRRALDSSPVYQGLMCFSAEEVSFLAEQGFDDFLLAYPTLQARALETVSLTARDKKISVVVDSMEGIEALAQAARTVGSKVGCVLELDVSRRSHFFEPIGARRSPLRTFEALHSLIKKIQELRELSFEGIMAYEGQVAGVQDRSPFRGRLMNFVYGWVRKIEAGAVAARRDRVIAHFQKEKIVCAIVNGGGSGSLSFALKEKCLTEIAVGSALVAPHLFSAYSNLAVTPALFVALEVVRSSETGWITCAGGGYIASGAPGKDRLLMPVYPAGSRLSALEGCGEVQTPLRLARGTTLVLGSAAFFRPAKAGEIAERVTSYQLWDTKTLHEVPTYRGAGVCLL